MGYGDFNINLPDGENFAPDENRVQEIASMMPSEPFHFGVDADERKDWARIANSVYGKRILGEAENAFALEPKPVVTDDVHLMCWEKDSPADMNAIAPMMRARMAVLPLAECLNPSGVYLSQVEEDIRAVLRLKSWLHPNNDQARDIFHGKTEFADLATFHFATNLTAADFLLKDRLNNDLRIQIRQEIERRVFEPFRRRIESGKDVYWWVTVTHNWNSVCLAGLLACALWLKEDVHERAWYVALVEKLLVYSEEGFTESGFYTEGVSYWGYGFGHYVQIAEMVRAVTKGQMDWLKKDKAKKIAEFGARMEIQNGRYPTFADCARDFRPTPWLTHWMNNRVDDQRKHRSTEVAVDSFDRIHFQVANQLLMILFHQEDVTQAFEGAFGKGQREWFDDVQFLICRPNGHSSGRLAATFKGGHNGVNHNHNDLGTFTVLLGGDELLTDPGGEVYTSRTFSKDRYEGDLLNSFGHPVPKVANQLQVPGEDAHAALLRESFSDACDEVMLDLKRAYDVPTLRTLTRTFRYLRDEERIEVVDVVVFVKPERFETALLTYSQWEPCADDSILIGEAASRLNVHVTSDVGPLVFDHCVIQESSTPTRLAWAFAEPILEARITISVCVGDLVTT